MEKAYLKQLQLFGSEIKRLRISKKLTQEGLADRCDIDIRTIQRIERGDFGIGLHNLFALSSALGMQPSELLTGIKIPKYQ